MQFGAAAPSCTPLVRLFLRALLFARDSLPSESLSVSLAPVGSRHPSRVAADCSRPNMLYSTTESVGCSDPERLLAFPRICQLRDP